VHSVGLAASFVAAHPQAVHSQVLQLHAPPSQQLHPLSQTPQTHWLAGFAWYECTAVMEPNTAIKLNNPAFNMASNLSKIQFMLDNLSIDLATTSIGRAKNDEC
jgi:hypothetical protein